MTVFLEKEDLTQSEILQITQADKKTETYTGFLERNAAIDADEACRSFSLSFGHNRIFLIPTINREFEEADRIIRRILNSNYTEYRDKNTEMENLTLHARETYDALTKTLEKTEIVIRNTIFPDI